MNDLIVKESWKCFFRKQLFLKFWKVALVLAAIGAVVGLVLCLVSGGGFPWWKYPLVVLLCAAGGFAMVISVLLFTLLFTLLFAGIPKMIAPNEWRFTIMEDKFVVRKNGKPWLITPYADTRYTFVIVNINGIPGNPKGDSLRLSYWDNGRARQKEINLAPVPDSEKDRMAAFMVYHFNKNL